MTLMQVAVSNNPCGAPIVITAMVIASTTNYIDWMARSRSIVPVDRSIINRMC
jgi:hypothetical protein